MRCFKFFDWPRKPQLNNGSGGNIVTKTIPQQMTGGSGVWVLFGSALVIKTSGRPVAISFQSEEGALKQGYLAVNNPSGGSTIFGDIELRRNGVTISSQSMTLRVGATTNTVDFNIPFSILNCIDVNAPSGSNSYELYYWAQSTSNYTARQTKIVAMEL